MALAAGNDRLFGPNLRHKYISRCISRAVHAVIGRRAGLRVIAHHRCGIGERLVRDRAEIDRRREDQRAAIVHQRFVKAERAGRVPRCFAVTRLRVAGRGRQIHADEGHVVRQRITQFDIIGRSRTVIADRDRKLDCVARVTSRRIGNFGDRHIRLDDINICNQISRILRIIRITPLGLNAVTCEVPIIV